MDPEIALPVPHSIYEYGEDFVRLYSEDQVKSLVRSMAQPAWVSVHHRLPTDEQYVVVFDPTNHPQVWPAKWDEEHGIFASDGGWFDLDEITHWMLLPRPPQG